MKLIIKNHSYYIIGLLLGLFSIVGFNYNNELSRSQEGNTPQDPELKLYEKSRTNFVLNSGDEVKLINSGIKQDYNIFLSGNIIEFDTLIIGKGRTRYLSSYILIERDSIIFYRITHIKQRKAYKHNLKLKNFLNISIDKTVNSSVVSIMNEQDTFSVNSNFVGMNNPFIHSVGSTIEIEKFEFNCSDYYADVFVFGDSYVSCSSSERWPFYIYNQGFKFLCDGLPGGRSNDSYDFLSSAFSVHKPKYVVWCLGMNGRSDTEETDPNWIRYMKKVMTVCDENNVTLILSTIPSVPSRNHTGKNKYVRASGYRYIDFDDAVSDGKGTWKSEMLSKDEVHPSKNGAKTMAERLIKDFPEIKNYMK